MSHEGKKKEKKKKEKNRWKKGEREKKGEKKKDLLPYFVLCVVRYSRYPVTIGN